MGCWRSHMVRFIFSLPARTDSIESFRNPSNKYAHIQQSSRVELGKKFESGFYAKPDTPSPQAVPAAGEPTISMTALLELLKDADPEMKAKLRLALLT